PKSVEIKKKENQGWFYWLAWVVAWLLITVALYLWLQRGLIPRTIAAPTREITPRPTMTALEFFDNDVVLPIYQHGRALSSIRRRVILNTLIPNRSRTEVVEYTVGRGDSVFGIARTFGIEPETVLWSNYDVLQDDPHSLSTGMELRIPPVDGIYYQWQEGDILESIASEFEADEEDVLAWAGNRLDLTDPQIETGAWVMIPNGQREIQQWIIPVPARGSAGVSTGMYGAGACAGGYDGIYGSGAFIWPTNYHTISGNDYWSGHLAIDIGVATGGPIVASDSGVIMFAGWAVGGYGFAVAIDHGNGYQTLYAHLSSVNVSCGQSVRQGQFIGLGGSTGNSTGPHLHFEVRYQGGFVNPWYVLPAP
ncbi:MAG: peptidoglycan DD-metalloendopeptidase family protein, partial [Chloroflexota bacterium]|nr:peptidoglycan DD-metalloendopeptidase family protein [Chloroflexota bacterium]